MLEVCACVFTEQQQPCSGMPSLQALCVAALTLRESGVSWGLHDREAVASGSIVIMIRCRDALQGLRWQW